MTRESTTFHGELVVGQHVRYSYTAMQEAR